MNTIDEIALRVAEKLEPRGRTYSPDHYIEFAHALLAELSKDEPVGWMTTGGGIAKDKAFFIELGFADRKLTPLFTRPIPANTAEIDQRVAELEADQVRTNTIANNYCALLMDANQQLLAEQSKVKVLTDALENIERHAVNPWASWALEALATVKEK